MAAVILSAPMMTPAPMTPGNMRENGMTPSIPAHAQILALVFAAAALAGCGRTYSPHTYAAADCWMSIEKSHPEWSLDKRAAIVNKCIDDKMKGQNP